MGPDIEAVWDLIVSDIRLPSGDGLLVLEALRRAGCGAPMIVMTAFGDEATRRRVEGLGGVLLEKPFPLEELTTAIDHLLFGTARRQQVGPP
jgi:DNA-binding response OmpR family regulator